MTDSPAVQPVVSRREQRKQEVRSRITEAAIALLEERGFDDTTVEDICLRAEVARKTFYNYYPSKRELVNELSESLLFDETLDVLHQAQERFPNVGAQLDFFFQQMADNIAAYRELERSLVHQALLNLSLEDNRAGEQLARLNAVFTAILENGMERGEVDRDEKPDFLAEMVVGAVNAVILNWVHDADYPVQQRIGDLRRFVRRLVLT